ncbi:MAG TPA: ATP-binding protein [bacterium]|nr:ATP-binding protein [bacterium]
MDQIEFEDLEAFRRTQPRESPRLDFKQPMDQRVVETVVAMVNTDGGLILVGVPEEVVAGQRTKGMGWPPTGVQASAEDAFMSMCRAAYGGDYLPKIKPLAIPDHAGRYVLFIRIDRHTRPRILRHDEKGVLMRVGDQNIPATIEQLEELLIHRPQRASDLEGLYEPLRADLDMALSTDGVITLTAAMRYPAPANGFGAPEREALRKAAAWCLGAYHELRVSSRYRQIEFRHGPSRDTALFYAVGMAVVKIRKLAATVAEWDWVLGETLVALRSLRGNDAGAVYPVVREGTVTLALNGWTSIGVTGLTPQLEEGSAGQRVIHDAEVDAGIANAAVAREFMAHVLDDAGYSGYETMLDMALANPDAFISSYVAGRALLGLRQRPQP